MKNILIALSLLIFLASCKEEPKPKSWQYSKALSLNGINPIGIANAENGIWLSDGDHNRVVLIDENGTVISTIDSLDRPMHISSEGSKVVIPQYGNDVILDWDNNEKKEIALNDSLDAPAGVWRMGSEIAIADFYNNRILYSENGEDWISFGKEGKADGDFYYPTDVQITDDAIWVADAYNNRVQVFYKTGKYIKQMGADQKMNAATGIYVSDDELFVTDFENNRVLVFDHEGNLKQELKENIAKPTDLILKDGKLLITNYRSGMVAIYDWLEIPENVDHDEHDHDEHDH